VTAPMDVTRRDYGPPVLEPLQVGVRSGGLSETGSSRRGRGRKPAPVPTAPPPVPSETVIGGSQDQPGRTFKIKGEPKP
ncbi:MAG TPA: hypothetical protein VGS21_05130, partial [Acidimicrobiales bacterium]|nr:hypothetical protein [Acidimicrobiales bacterium]